MSEVRLEGYRLIDAIGSGAVSTLYRAVHDATGREVVLKALKTSIPPTSSFAAQLEREARVLADMSHPNIVLLIDFKKGEFGGGRTFLVLERIDGFSLRDLLRKKRALRVDTSCAIACEVLSGLEHAHSRGVIHRDIKPENIMLGKRGDVKIVDFGIAQRDKLPSANEPLVPIAAQSSLTDKEPFGAPAYMSPEQVLGELVDERSDLYSLGVLLYRMLSGERPFAEGKPHERGASSMRARRDTPVPLRERAPHIPRSLEVIVMRLLERKMEDRYANATIVRELLEPFARGASKELHAKLVRRVLGEAGLSKDDSRRDDDRTGSYRRERPSLNMVVFVAIGLVFSGIGALIQVTSQKDHRTRETGSQALPLAPEEAGGLRVLATPWAEVWVDGERVEVTPFARPIPLAAGTHFVTLHHPNAPDEKRTITVTPSEVVSLDVTMRIAEGKK